MTNVIVSGHGGYAAGMQKSMSMLFGDPQGFQYVDFFPEDGTEGLEKKFHEALLACTNNEVLFCCDLLGGTPFRIAATICAANEHMMVAAGINLMAFAEISMNLQMPVRELTKLAVDTTRMSVGCFPPLIEDE